MSTKDTEATAETQGSTVENGVKIIGEAALMPGTSQLLDGNIASGAGHAVGGLVARSLIGPIGWVLAAANSYSKSTTGKHLHQHFSSSK